MESEWHCENATSAKMRDIDDTLSFDLLCSLYSLAVIDFIIVFSATFVLDTQCQRNYTDHPAYCHLSVLISRTLVVEVSLK